MRRRFCAAVFLLRVDLWILLSGYSDFARKNGGVLFTGPCEHTLPQPSAEDVTVYVDDTADVIGTLTEYFRSTLPADSYNLTLSQIDGTLTIDGTDYTTDTTIATITETTMTLTNADVSNANQPQVICVTDPTAVNTTTAADIVTGVAVGYTWAKVTTTNKLGDEVVNVFKITVLPNEFYVYHSSDGSVDAIPMSAVDANGKDNLVPLVKSSHRYGGYYAGIGNLTAANFTDGVLNDGITALTYDGSKLYYSGVKAYWKAPVTSTVGTAIEPVPGAYYFLKEVPVAYLTSRIQFVYDWAQNYKLQKMFFHTVVDDKLYSEIGFEITTSDRRVAKIVSSFKFTPANGGTVITTKPTDFGVSRGFIGYIDYTDDLAGSDGFLKANEQFTVQPYWITPDGVTVYGTARTFNTGDGTNYSSGIHEVT